MLELDGQILIRIGFLLVRQHDIQPHRRACARKCALVRRFHNPRPAARNNGKTGIRELACQPQRKFIIGMVFRRARAAVNADRRLNRPQLLARFDKFRNNLQNMIRLPRLNLAARLIGQHRLGQFFEQAHGFSFILLNPHIVTDRTRGRLKTQT